MIRPVFISCAFSFGLCLIAEKPAMAWHLQSQIACLREASAPDCGQSGFPVCVAREECPSEASKTISACTEWRCEPQK